MGFCVRAVRTQDKAFRFSCSGQDGGYRSGANRRNKLTSRLRGLWRRRSRKSSLGAIGTVRHRDRAMAAVVSLPALPFSLAQASYAQHALRRLILTTHSSGPINRFAHNLAN